MAIPVTLEDARRQIRLEEDDESRDTDLTVWIADAAAWIERYTGHILVAREVTETFAAFGRIRLRAWPVAPNAVVALDYGLPGEVATTIADARLFGHGRPATILRPAALAWWPILPRGGVISVTFRAGYEETDPVPGNFRRAMLILIAAYNGDREGGELFAMAEATAKGLCRDFRARQL